MIAPLIIPDSVDRDRLPERYRAFSGDSSFASGHARNWIHSHGLMSVQRSEQMTEPYTQSEWVYGCVRLISTLLAALPVRVWKGTPDDREEVTSGEVFDLMQEPCKGMTPEQCWQSVISWLLLRGETFLAPVLSNGRIIPREGVVPTHFKAVAPDRVFRSKDSERWEIETGRGNIHGMGVFGNVNSATKRLPVEDEFLLHPHLWNPHSAFRGMSPLLLATLSADPMYQASLFNAALLRNNGDPGGWVELSEAMNPAEVERSRQLWAQRQQGPQNAGKTAFLSRGAKYVPNPNSNKQMQFLELIHNGRDTITGAVYFVPKSMLGVTDAINFATARVEERGFWTRAALPTGRLIMGTISLWLQKQARVDEWVEFDHSGVDALQENKGEQAATAKTLTDMGFTGNEVNAHLQMGLPTDKDWRDEAYTQASTVTVSSVAGGFDGESEQAEASAQPAEAPDTGGVSAGAATAAGAEVQKTALSGGQITSLLEIVSQIAKANLTPGAGKALIAIAFPDVDPALVDSLVAGAVASEPAAPPPQLAGPDTQDDPPPPSTSSPQSSPNAEEGGRSLRTNTRVQPAKRSKVDRHQRRAWLQEYQTRVLSKQERKLNKVALSYFRALALETARLFKAQVKGKKPGDRVFPKWDVTKGDLVGYLFPAAGTRAGLSDSQVEAVLFSRNQWNEEIAKRFDDPFWGVMETAGSEINRELGVGQFSLNRGDPRWLELHGNRVAELVKVNDTLREQIKGRLIKGVSEDMTVRELQQELVGVFQGNAARSLRIARTETGMLASGTRQVVMKDEGVEKKEWVSSGDDIVRESHGPAPGVDGEIVGIDERFSNGLLHPLEIGADPAEVVNCRCDSVAVLALDAEETVET